MRLNAVRAALAANGVVATKVQRITQGSANWTFLINNSLIVRFPRSVEVAAATRREIQLLPLLVEHVSFAVPKPTIIGTWKKQNQEIPFFGYNRIAGIGLRPEDITDALIDQFSSFLISLHSLPILSVPLGVGERSAQTAWHDRYVHLWTSFERFVLPELEPNLAHVVRRRYFDMLDNPPVFDFCLVHTDLGLEHVLVDHTGTNLIGIIDFENAAIGDPAVDLAPISAVLSGPQLQRLIGNLNQLGSLGDRLDERIKFYRWVGSMHAILYGVREGDNNERRAGIEGLRNRLAPWN